MRATARLANYRRILPQPRLVVAAITVLALTGSLSASALAMRPAADSDAPAVVVVASAPVPIDTATPIVQQAFALAGAPAATPLECSRDIPAGENGWAWWSPASLIRLQPDICDGLSWLQGDDSERLFFSDNHPFTAWPGQGGVSALVLLHEATHIAGDHDETDTECRALRLLPALLTQYLSGDLLGQALRSAAAYDSFLPTLYHQHPC